VPEPVAEGDTFALLAAYSRLMADPDPRVREQAARDWVTWEDTVISLESNGRPGAYGDRPADAVMALTRICAHYFANGAWLEEGVLLREAGRLAGIPGVLIHGRLDLGGPPETAWELARAWPDARLVMIEDSGHTGSETMRKEIQAAVDAFAAR
jgi:proline iminopeptidase